MKLPRAYAVPAHEEIYTQISIDNHLEALRDKGVGRYRCKTIISGTTLELEIYSLPKPQKGQRSMPEKPSRQTQINLNNANKQKLVMRLVNANFTSNDMWATLDYKTAYTPQSEEKAYKNIKNYIRRLKRHTKKHGLAELKYIYVTEWVQNSKTGKIHAHHHIVMNFPDRDKAEEIWKVGFRPQTRRLQPDDYGLNGLA
jgi:uncharacterized protein (DUF1330 family)